MKTDQREFPIRIQDFPRVGVKGYMSQFQGLGLCC